MNTCLSLIPTIFSGTRLVFAKSSMFATSARARMRAVAAGSSASLKVLSESVAARICVLHASETGSASICARNATFFEIGDQLEVERPVVRRGILEHVAEIGAVERQRAAVNGHGVGSQVAAHERLVETGPLYDLAQRPFGSLHIRLFDGAVGLGHDKRVLGVLFEDGGYGGAHVAPTTAERNAVVNSSEIAALCPKRVLRHQLAVSAPITMLFFAARPVRKRSHA